MIRAAKKGMKMSWADLVCNKLNYETARRDVSATNRHAKIGPFVAILFQFSKASSILFKSMSGSEISSKRKHDEEEEKMKW